MIASPACNFIQIGTLAQFFFCEIFMNFFFLMNCLFIEYLRWRFLHGRVGNTCFARNITLAWDLFILSIYLTILILEKYTTVTPRIFSLLDL